MDSNNPSPYRNERSNTETTARSSGTNLPLRHTIIVNALRPAALASTKEGTRTTADCNAAGCSARRRSLAEAGHVASVPTNRHGLTSATTAHDAVIDISRWTYARSRGTARTRDAHAAEAARGSARGHR